MASEDVKTRESAVSTTVNLSEEVELAREGVKTPGPALLSICKSLFAGGVAGGVMQYNGTIQGLKYIWRTEGLRGMFKGNGTNCARIVPNSAVKFFSYEEASEDKSPRQYRGIAHALSTVLKEEGPRALYKGWVPSVIGVDNELGVETRLACGAAAGTAGQTVAYPLDVIRRRMQMVGWKDAASVVSGDGKGKAALEYTGMVDAFRKTVRHEGFGALYKGLVPNSVKVIPSIAIAFVTYEMVKVVLGVEMMISG